MKIEILFPELCNLYGDLANIKYLKKCLPDAEFIETSILDNPRFADDNIDLIYLGSMTEKTQEKVIEKLRPYTETIKKLINENINFLFTGNSFEILGQYIEQETGEKIECLGIINTFAKREMFNRYNGLYLGRFNEIELVGFKAQFSLSYGDNNDNYFSIAEKGIGINRNNNLEGIKINNFIGTYILGPILILNPLFTKYLLQQLGVESTKIAFEQVSFESYNQRLN